MRRRPDDPCHGLHHGGKVVRQASTKARRCRYCTLAQPLMLARRRRRRRRQTPPVTLKPGDPKLALCVTLSDGDEPRLAVWGSGDGVHLHLPSSTFLASTLPALLRMRVCIMWCSAAVEAGADVHASTSSACSCGAATKQDRTARIQQCSGLPRRDRQGSG